MTAALLEASYDFGQTWETATFDATTEVTGAPVLRRWQPPTQKLPNGVVRYRISDTISGEGGPPVPSLGVAWYGLSIEPTALGGSVKLGAGQRR